MRIFTFGGTAVLAACVLALGCGGGSADAGKGKTKGKGKGKAKSDAAATGEIKATPAAQAAYDKLAVATTSAQDDDEGFAKLAAEARKACAGGGLAEKVEQVVKDFKESREQTMRDWVAQIKGESADPANEPHPERYLERLDKLEAKAATISKEVAAEIAPEIGKTRAKLLGKVYKKDVEVYEVAHREEVDEILTRIEGFKKRLANSGDAGAELRKQCEADGARMEERREWIKRAPAGEIDLAAAAAKDGWKISGPATIAYEDGAMIVKHTGEGKAAGILYATHAWWRDYEVEIGCSIASGTFQVVARCLGARGGVGESIKSATFGTDTPLTFTLKATGADGTLSGDKLDEIPLKQSLPPAGGFGLYVFPGAVVKLTTLKLTPK